MTNKDLYEKAEEAINELFSDMSVSKEKCKQNLRNLISDLEIKIQSLD